MPALQVSFAVHVFPSLHGSLLFTWLPLLAELYPSSVHTLFPSQLGAGPPWQVPPPQVSFVVQASPSLQGPVLFECVQPVPELHPSSVHTLVSSQFGGGPP